jgi:hypothetical protein
VVVTDLGGPSVASLTTAGGFERNRARRLSWCMEATTSVRRASLGTSTTESPKLGMRTPASAGERAAAGVVLLLLLPVLILLWATVRMVLGGPALIRGQRPGARAFARPVLRFRTSVDPRRLRALRSWSQRFDGAFGARLGAVMGRYGLDQMPAVWDVARHATSLRGRPDLVVSGAGLSLIPSSAAQPLAREPAASSRASVARSTSYPSS